MNLRFIKPIIAFVILVIAGITYNPIDMLSIKDEPEEKVVAKVVDPKQLACMAKNIFYEAGHESIMGQAAVARVVLNRVSHGFARNPCAVVYQAHTVDRVIDDEIVKVKLCQFSWVCEGKGEPNKNSQRYKQAYQVAYDVMANDAYSEVVDFIRTNEAIENELGKVNGFTILPAGSFHKVMDNAGTSGTATFVFLVKGENQFKEIQFVVEKKADLPDWEVVGFE